MVKQFRGFEVDSVEQAVVSPSRSTIKPVPAPPLKVGVVGLGRVGQRRARLVEAHPDLTLQALCDTNPNQAGAFPDVPYFETYDRLLQEDLDVVFVAAYNKVAPDIVIRSLNAGNHVFCEKPPGRSVADVQRMIDAERANPGLKLQFGFNHRHHYAVSETKAMVESGRFGKVLWMRGVYGKAGSLDFESDWRSNTDLAGGGILLDQGIHMVDLFRYIAGEFTEVKSLITTSFWNIPLEDNAFAILHNAQNQVAMLHSSATQWKHRFSLEICLEGGYINVNGILSSTRSYGEESITFARRQFEDEAFAFGKPREEMIFFDRDDSWALEVAAFVKAIREDTPIPSGNSDDALQVMQLIEQIYREGKA